MIKEAENSLKIPQTYCQVHTERSVLSVCLDQDCPYRGMFCYQCIKFHYQHLDKTFEIKEFLNLINENINDLSFNMLPTSPSPSLKDIYKNKFDQLQMNKENLLRQKELVIEAVCKYVELAIENSENKVDVIESKNPASQDTQSIQELTNYQEKFFDLANLQSDELYDLLIYFSKFIHKEDDKIEIINFSPSNNGQIPKSQSLVIENDLDNTCQNLRNSELVLQKLTGILDHLPPDDRSAHQKLSCLKVAPQQTPRRFGQPVTFQPNPNPNLGGYNSTYHHNSISLSNHFQRASSNQNNNQNMGAQSNESGNHHHRNSHYGNSNNFQSQNSGQNGNKFTQFTNNSNTNSNNNSQQNSQNGQFKQQEQQENTNTNTNQSTETGDNNGSGASTFLQKFQQKLNENSKNNTENSQNSSNSNSTAASTTQQTSSSNQIQNTTSSQNNPKQTGSSQANIAKLQHLVQQQNAQMAASVNSQHTQGFHSLAQHFQSASQSQNQNNNSTNERMSYQQKKLQQQGQSGNYKRSEVLSEQRLALRSVEHFCDALEVGYNTAWCVSFRTQKECALNGIYHMPIFVYDSTVGASLESAYLQLSLFDGNNSFSKKLYEQSFLLKKTNKHISSDETNLMNVLEKININTSYKLRKNSEYTIVIRNKTSEQEDASNLKQLYMLYGDDQAEELKNQGECEGSKLINFIKTNTTNLSSQLENTKLITQNNDSLEDPQLSDYFIPYLSISQLPEQQQYKSNYYSSSNAVGAEEENEQKTPKRNEYEHNHLGNIYNNQNQRGGYKDYMNNFKSGTGFSGSSQNVNQMGNAQGSENDYSKYNRNNQGNNKRKYHGGEGSQRDYNSSNRDYNSTRSNNGQSYSNSQNNTFQQSSSYQSTNYEKSSVIPGFIPQKKQKK